ncbi:efflux transporter outer membrane subunit [Prosthecochloris sp. SCSIO W1102]|uniref:efflux transporter outer membrane subunit n=1 Tax=Prosthecochloris sp. SCSIO W1102 TaxID=2992243 RepID=UPI00223E3375|nr:efflux transporter outer membrane subunit [Prosthecochloris sp. SCSIO W1102]UZJ39534.1 efflux transporter outer membrane subunit [Prosthecochloris sp. SCSIO W1102]
MNRTRVPGIFLILMFLLMFSACSTVEEYSQPDPGIPGMYRGADKPDSASVAAPFSGTVPYRAFFVDPTLINLIDAAIENNHDLQVAVKNIEYASLALKQSKLGNIPTLDFQVSGSRSTTSDYSSTALSTGEESIEDYNASFLLSWEADIWGKIRNTRKAALAEYLRTVEARKAVHTRLVADVAVGYYNLLLLDAQLDVTKKNLALAETTLSMMRLQYDAGLVTSLAVEQQEARTFEIQSSIAGIEQGITVQENALSVLCGRMPERIARTAKLSELSAENSFSPGVPALLLSNRPDVKTAEMALMKAHAESGVASAKLYPSFSISAEAGANALEASDWFNFPGSLFSFVQGAVLQPVFQQGKLRTAYKQSKVERDKEEILFRKVVLDAVREVSDALVAIQKLENREKAVEKQERILRQSVDNANFLFKSGLADYLEVITAQSNALDASLSLADLHRQRLNARTELYRALGGGWE